MLNLEKLENLRFEKYNRIKEKLSVKWKLIFELLTILDQIKTEFSMRRVNGIGTTLLGVSRMDKNNVATATQWFTILFLPIIPLVRYYVQFLPPEGSEYSYIILSKDKLNIKEILKTYLFGWIIVPILLFGSIMGAIYFIIFLSNFTFVKAHTNIFGYVFVIGLIIGWLFCFFYFWGKWKKNKYHPQNNKN